MKTKFKELDVVRLSPEITGTIVHVYNKGEAYEVELFGEENGEPVELRVVIALPAKYIRPDWPSQGKMSTNTDSATATSYRRMPNTQ